MTQRQRVLLHAFSTFSLGGAQARFVQLANAYGPDFRHLIVAMDGNFSAADRLGASVNWEAMPVENRRGSGLANRRPFREHLSAWRPDAVFTYNFGAIEWAAANLPRVAPHVHVEDGFGPQEAQQQLARRVWTRRVLLGLGGVSVVVPSLTLARLAPSWWIPSQRLRYIPNGVNVIPTTQSQRNGDRRETIIVCVGGLRPEKNVARLIKACAVVGQRHPLRLLVVGDGPERSSLETLVQSSGLAERVSFVGHVADPQGCLAQADVFALSSDTEQLPIALLEAMSLGLPSVVTAVGDVPEVLPAQARAGLAPPDDEGYAQALERVLSQPDAWPQWAAASQQRVRSAYDKGSMLQQWRLVFDGRFDRVSQSKEAHA